MSGGGHAGAPVTLRGNTELHLCVETAKEQGLAVKHKCNLRGVRSRGPELTESWLGVPRHHPSTL